MEVRPHSEYCAVLSVATHAATHGLVKVARRLLCSFESATALGLAKAIIRTLSLRRELLMDVVQRMANQYCVNPGSTRGNACPETELRMNAQCFVDGNAGARAVRARTELRQGETVLREEPRYIVPSYSCSCSAEGTVLAEHIELAWTVHSREWPGAAGESRPRTSDVLISGCRGVYTPDLNVVSNQWPLRTIIVMITSSFLCVSMFASYNDDFEHQCLSVLDVLSRLPQNTHAVDVVNSTVLQYPTGICDTVTQRRVGIAIFLQASAMNHSCDPNCSVKFAKVKSRGAIDADVRYELEIVAVRKIAPGEELTVSYGVVSGRHSFLQRRETLVSQYLFLCLCPSCSQAEIEETAIDGKMLKLSHHERLTKMIVDLEAVMNAHFKGLDGERADVENMLRRLKSYYEQVCINKTVDPEYWNCRIVQLECRHLDYCANILAVRGYFSAAADVVSTAVNLLLKAGIYSIRDVAIGREFVKLSELHSAAGEDSDAHRYAWRAFSCLNGFVCDEDPDFLALINNYPELMDLEYKS